MQLVSAAGTRAHVAQLEDRLTGGRGRASCRRDFMTDNHFGQSRPIGSGCRPLADHASGPQHHHPTASGDYLVQLVADEDDRQSLFGHLSQGAEQGLGFLKREHRCGFVQDQDARRAIERLQNLHPLALTHREVADQCIGMDIESETPGKLPQFVGRSPAVRVNPPHRLRSEDDVVEHAQVVREGEVLVHHADSGGDSGPRRACGQGLAERLDLAVVGHVVTEQDAHQGGLAGPVLAEKPKHLTAPKLERDVVVRDEVAEALGDPRDSQHYLACRLVHDRRTRLRHGADDAGRAAGREGRCPPPRARMAAIRSPNVGMRLIRSPVESPGRPGATFESVGGNASTLSRTARVDSRPPASSGR